MSSIFKNIFSQNWLNILPPLPKRKTIGMVSCTAGVFFLAYCVYFDHKRRSAPDYKKKVHERRMRQLAAGEEKPDFEEDVEEVPDNLPEQEVIERKFLNKIYYGEMLISRGDVEEGVDNLAQAITLCSKPQALIELLSPLFPPQVARALVHRLRELHNAGLFAGFQEISETSSTQDDVSGSSVAQ